MEGSTSAKQLFLSEPDFCPWCGAILMLPRTGNTVTCVVCTFSISLDDLLGRTTTYNVDINPLGIHTTSKKNKKNSKKNKKNRSQTNGTNGEEEEEEEEDNDDGTEELGQMDKERECSKCNNIGMSYTTMQLRSADEGQTIFYICPKCRHREVENS